MFGLIALTLLLLAGIVAGTRWWVLRQYYVGAAEDGQVSIFQGVRGSLFGFKFHNLVEGSCPPNQADCTPIMVDDLKISTRDVVRNGIADVDGLAGARAAIERLKAEQLLPLCASAEEQSSAPVTTSENPASTTTNPPPGESSSAPPTTTTDEMTALPTPNQKPGVDCRKGP